MVMGAATAIILVIIAVFLLLLIYLYNTFIIYSIRVRNSSAQIDVLLKRRHDLIPALEDYVKEYMKHERKTLENISRERKSLISGSLDERARASDKIAKDIRSIFAVSESYPRLRANENFKKLQKELSETESGIAVSRQFYNDIVMRYNRRILIFPNNIFAKIFGFREKDFFMADGAEKKPAKVKV